MKNIKPGSSIFSQALSEAVRDFAEEMGCKPENNNETATSAGRKAVTGVGIVSISQQDILDKTGQVRVA